MKGRSSAFAREGLMRTCNLICRIWMFMMQSALEHLIIAFAPFAFRSHFSLLRTSDLRMKANGMRTECESGSCDMTSKHQTKDVNLQIAVPRSQIRIEVSHDMAHDASFASTLPLGLFFVLVRCRSGQGHPPIWPSLRRQSARFRGRTRPESRHWSVKQSSCPFNLPHLG